MTVRSAATTAALAAVLTASCTGSSTPDRAALPDPCALLTAEQLRPVFGARFVPPEHVDSSPERITCRWADIPGIADTDPFQQSGRIASVDVESRDPELYEDSAEFCSLYTGQRPGQRQVLIEGWSGAMTLDGQLRLCRGDVRLTVGASSLHADDERVVLDLATAAVAAIGRAPRFTGVPEPPPSRYDAADVRGIGCELLPDDVQLAVLGAVDDEAYDSGRGCSTRSYFDEGPVESRGLRVHTILKNSGLSADRGVSDTDVARRQVDGWMRATAATPTPGLGDLAGFSVDPTQNPNMPSYEIEAGVAKILVGNLIVEITIYGDDRVDDRRYVPMAEAELEQDLRLVARRAVEQLPG